MLGVVRQQVMVDDVIPDRDASQPTISVTGVSRWIGWAMEGVLLVMLVAGPWMYGAVHPGFEFVLDVGLLLLLVLWATRMLRVASFERSACMNSRRAAIGGSSPR